MILSGQTIRRMCLAGDKYEPPKPMIHPFFERTTHENADGTKLTWGLGPAGYDVRVEFDKKGAVTFAEIAPGSFLLASTIERFVMPIDVLAEVKDKSSWARRGLAVQNTVVEPGWRGYLTLELTNHGQYPILLERGMPIAQMIFHKIDESVDLPYEAGKYQDQGRGPREAK